VSKAVFDHNSDTAAPRLASSFPAFSESLQFAALPNWLEALEVTPLGAREWQCQPTWLLGPRVLMDSMYFLFHNGHGRGYVDDQHFDIKAGDMMLIPKGAAHFVEPGKGVAFHLSTMHFHAHVFGGINILDLLGFPVHFRLKKGRDDLIYILAEQLNRESAVQAPGHQQASQAAMTTILLHLIRHFGPQFKPQRHSGKAVELRRLLPAFDYVERNLADGSINVVSMAKKSFVGDVQFRKLFRRVTGMSPVRYVQSRRIDRACRALIETDHSVEQVAHDCGFADAPFFCRVFKKWTKGTPAQYRANAHSNQ
jgi:AraC-like DNA-binding protein